LAHVCPVEAVEAVDPENEFLLVAEPVLEGGVLFEKGFEVLFHLLDVSLGSVLLLVVVEVEVDHPGFAVKSVNLVLKMMGQSGFGGLFVVLVEEVEDANPVVL